MEQTLSIQITADNKQALTGIRQVQASAFNLKEELLRYQGLAFTEKDQAKVSAYNRRIQELQASLKQTTNIGKEGFDAMGNAIKSAGNPLTEAYSGLRKIAYILPGIGIAGIFNLAFEGIGKLASELGVFNVKLTDTQKKYAALNEVEKETQKNAGTELANLKLLYHAATDHNGAMNDRIKAATELKKEYPDILKNLTAEQIAAGGAADAYKTLTERVIENARASAVASKIGELEAQRLQAEANKKKINAVVNSEIATAKTYNTGGEADATISKEDQITNANNRRNKALKEQDAILKNIDDTEKLLLSTTTTKGIVDELADGTKSEKLSKLQQILKQLADTLYGLQNQKAIGFIGEDLFNADKLKAFNIALAELSKLGSDGAAAFNKLSVEEKKLFLSEFAKKISAPEQYPTAPFEKQVKEAKPRYINGVPQFLDDANKQAGESKIEYNKKLDEAKAKELNAILKETETIMKAIGPAVDHIFDAFANGENVIKALGDSFKSLALDIAKAAAKAELFELIKKGITLAGGSTSGGFFGSFAKLLGFADGGVASGPKSGYPVMLHGTEAVFNGGQLTRLINNVSASTRAGMQGMQSGNSSELNKLHSAIAQLANQPMQVIPFLKGSDWNLMVGRVQQQTQRNY